MNRHDDRRGVGVRLMGGLRVDDVGVRPQPPVHKSPTVRMPRRQKRETSHDFE